MTSIVDLANKKKEWAAASSAPKTPSVVKPAADKHLPALTPKAKSAFLMLIASMHYNHT